MSFLTLPPEIIHKIFHYTLQPSPFDPLQITPLTLIHRSLTSFAQQFLFLHLYLCSDDQIGELLQCRNFRDWVGCVRSVRFDGTRSREEDDDDDDEGRISQDSIRRLLHFMEIHQRKQNGKGEGLKELSLKGCRGISSSIFENRVLKDVKRLTLGPDLTFQNSDHDDDDDADYLQIESLTLSSDCRKDSIPAYILRKVLSPTSNLQGQGESVEPSLKTLNLSTNLSSTNSIQYLFPTEEALNSKTYFSNLEEYYFPPISQIFSYTTRVQGIMEGITVLSNKERTTSLSEEPLLYYLEIPKIQNPRGDHLAQMFFNWFSQERGKIVEVGFRGLPGRGKNSLFWSIHQFLTVRYGDGEGRGGENSKGCTKRIRIVDSDSDTEGIPVRAEGSNAELVSMVKNFGLEVVFGKYERRKESGRGWADGKL